MKSKIEINNTDLVIRPSSIDSFLGCSYQWARVFLTGETSIPNARAAIGTAIHRGVEVMWRDAMKINNKDIMHLSSAQDAAVEEFEKETSNGVSYDEDENFNTATKEVVAGVSAFLEDIVPFAEIPDEVEVRYTIPIEDHVLVKALSGTLDYRVTDTIADVKTSKRKATPSSYEIQQSLYRTLVKANGIAVNHNLIQNVVLTKVPNGQILDMPTNEDKAKTIVNNLLDTLTVLASDLIKPELLFRGNPKYYLCSEKYCAFYNDCMFTKGENPEDKTATIVRL